MGSITLHVLNVGHGDSLVLEFEDGKTFAIIDCNRISARWNRQPYNDSDVRAITFFNDVKRNRGNVVIAFVCVTHPHYDHYSGLPALLRHIIDNNIEIKEYWDFGHCATKAKSMARMARTSEQIRRKAELFDLSKIKLHLCDRGCRPRAIVAPESGFWKGLGVVIDAIAPSAFNYEMYGMYQSGANDPMTARYFRESLPEMSDDNIICSAFSIRYGKSTIILGSDLTNAAWREILRRLDNNLCCNALKVSHHGAREGNFPDKQECISKSLSCNSHAPIAVISGGYRRNLPHPDVLNGFRESSIPIFCTGPLRREDIVIQTPTSPDEGLGQIIIEDGLEALDDADDNYSDGSGHGDVKVVCSDDGKSNCLPTNKLD